VLPAFGTCVWNCGRRDFNREHIIGLQIAKLLDTTPPVTVRWGNYVKSGEVMEVVLRDRVCKGCNENWMRKLDRRMVAFMADTIRNDEPVVLNEKRQLTLAHWAVKVALLFLLHLNDEKPPEARRSDLEMFSAPADNFASVFKRQRPPPRTRVWVGAREERAADRLIVYSSTLFAPIGLKPFGYGVVISLHKLVFVVRGVEAAYDGPMEGVNEPFDSLVPRALLSIWPTSNAELAWPPERKLSPDEIAHLGAAPPQ
jgi:hypothetical protein